MKRIISILMLLIFLVSMASCGRDPDPVAVSAPFATEPPAAEVPSASEEPAEMPESPVPDTPAEAEEELTEEDEGGLYVTDVYIVELEEGQALGGG